VPVTFKTPTAFGGQPPIAVLCSSPSGTAFPPGSTVVTCTATDGLTRQGSCSFSVTITVTPRISKTKYLAFGDSITNGRCGPPPGQCPTYASRVEELLVARYTAQTFTVNNRGVNGETTAEGERQLPSELAKYRPEVLMLMEGTNDVTGPTPLSQTLDSLEDMIDIARAGGVTAVFLATIPPIAPGGPNNSVIPEVVPLNAGIRDLAARKDVYLVDVYAALIVDVPRYYSGNDLHPTGEGLRLIGDTFYAAIVSALDITPRSAALMPPGVGDLTLPRKAPGNRRRIQ
jgi:lysophospholipase L1-like esterase